MQYGKGKSKPKKPDSIFTFRDLKVPYNGGSGSDSGGAVSRNSRPMTYALNTALNYLNYEFGEKKFPLVPVPRPGVTFKAAKANKMDVVDNLDVGTRLKPQQTRHVLLGK